MKIPAEKYDSGVNMSAVHCGFARRAKKIAKEMQQMCKTQIRAKTFKVYATKHCSL